MSLATFVWYFALLPTLASQFVWQAESSPAQQRAGNSDHSGAEILLHQEQTASAPPEAAAGPLEQPMARGERVAEIDKSCWIVFQDKSDNYWFGSDGNGVSRFDGKTITRFTTKDGLAHDQVRGIQQHGPSGDILITTNGGVSKFDGKRLLTLPILEMNAPAVVAASTGALDSTVLADAGWVLRAEDLWLTGGNGPRRYDGKTLHQLKFPKSPLDEELTARLGTAKNWSAYDVWTVYKDRKGQMWFGTAMFGVCRFDGRSFDWMYEPHLTEAPNGGWFGFRSIIEDRSGDFWICNTQFRFKMQPHAASEPREGRLKYVRDKGMDLGGSATTDNYIYYQSITEDRDRNLWMAPYAGGVWKYDGKTVTHFPMKIGEQEITMFTIYKDNRGDLWVGTHEHGPYRFNGKAFERFKP